MKLWYFSWISSSNVKQSFRWNWFQIGSCYILYDEAKELIHLFFLRTCTLTKCTIAIRTTNKPNNKQTDTSRQWDIIIWCLEEMSDQAMKRHGGNINAYY